MPTTPHIEKHFMAGETIRDIVIGMSDGLTVPFALAAGLSGAAVGTAVVVTAGLAEITAGSIAMGLGGYLAARSDIEHYANEKRQQMVELQSVPEEEKEQLKNYFMRYGATVEHVTILVDAMAARADTFVELMMRFELGLQAPDPKRAPKSALTIAISYLVGGMIPLSPYILFKNMATAQLVSVVVTMIALIVFGYVKARLTGSPAVKGAIQTVFIGGVAAGVAYLVARLIG
jgi:VIT1/CCC1 family predicted Fe2+/Mn2+ transporter